MKRIREHFNPWLVVVGGFLVMALLHSMIQTCFSLFLSPVVNHMGVTRTAFSFCTSLVGISTAVLAPTMGRLLGTSKYTRKVFLLCIVGMALSYASYALAGQIWHMYISAIFVGIFSCGAISMPISIIIANWFEKRRGLAMSIALAGSGIGGSIITPILTEVIDRSGWRSAFLLFSLAMIVIEIPVALLLMPTTPQHENFSEGFLTKDIPENEGRSIPLSWLKEQPFFYIYLVGMFAVSFVGYGSLSHLALHLTDVYDAEFSNAIISFFLLILTPAKIVLGYIYDKLGAKFGTILVMICHAVSFLMLHFTGSESMMWFMAVFFSIGISNGTVAPSVVTPLLFGTKEYGTIFGYVYSFCMIGMVVGSPFIALIFDVTGTYQLAWSTCFAICLLSIICLVYADNRCEYAVKLLSPINKITK